LHNEKRVDALVRELLEENGITLSLDDLTMLSDAPVRVALPRGRRQLVNVFSAYVPVPYVTSNLRTLAKLEQVVTAQSTINPDGSYFVPATNDIDGLSLTPVKYGLLSALKRKFELLHCGYVSQWETFLLAITTQHVLYHDDTS
jgi:ADP-ribose pyrophosphatase YjhB (NUDIX family)